MATGPVLLGWTLYYLPGDGWVRGAVARRSRTQGFSWAVPVSRIGPRSESESALGARAAILDWQLDAASHGPAGRQALLCPTARLARPLV